MAKKNNKGTKDDPAKAEADPRAVRPTKRVARPRRPVPRKPIRISSAAIRKRAYEIYLSRNCQDGFAAQDWLQAETELTEAGISSR